MSKKQKKSYKKSNKENLQKFYISKNIILALTLLIVFVSATGFLYFKWNNSHLQVPTLFAANTVLQRNRPVRVYGKGKPGMIVLVEIAGKKAQSRIGFDGLWQVSLPSLQAGGPFLLKISSGSEVKIIEPVYIGDVWFASGQSNMAWYVDSDSNGEANVREANKYCGKIFWFQARSNPSLHPKDAFAPDIGNWITIDSHNVKNLSAVAYAFARELYKDQHVPIGIIQATHGNTKIRSWMSTETLNSIPDYQTEYRDAIKKSSTDSLIWYVSGFGFNADTANLVGDFALRIGSGSMPYYTVWFNNRKLNNLASLNYHKIPMRYLDWQNTILIRIHAKGLSKSQLQAIDEDIRKTMLREANNLMFITTWKRELVPNTDLPSSVYNSMIHPFIPYSINGILWYQGESDVSEYQKYSILFTNFIKDLRTKWHEQLPVFYVQLHSYKSPGEEDLLPRFREAQERLIRTVPANYMITAIDLGEDQGDIHPKIKDPVGHRLALAVRKQFYHENDIKYSGPTFNRFEKQGKSLKIYFNDVAGSLVTSDQSSSATGFSIAGADRKFYSADAQLNSNTIELSSTQVPDPIAIRYAWSDMQTLNLYDSASLPVWPFRTDSW